MAYTVHQAKTNFSKLLKEAEEGKEIIIMRGKEPVAKLVPIEPAAPLRRILGGFEHLPMPDPAIFDPLTDEQMVEYGFDNPEKDARFASIVGEKSVRDIPA